MSDLPEEFEETYIGIHVIDPKEHEMPSIRFGPGFFLGMFMGFMFLSLLLVVSMLVCSRAQEAVVSGQRKAKGAKQEEEFKSNITCKPWGEDLEATEEMSEGSEFGSSATGAPDSQSDLSSFSAHGVASTDEELPMPPSLNKQKDGSVCALCTEGYELGQPVYESNNPHCGHQFHQVCMDKWLQCQNTCQVCNQHFVLQTV